MEETIILVAVLLWLALIAACALGIIFSYIAITHSVKKRIVSGINFSAGEVFLWILGWGLAAAYSIGIALVIYFLVKRSEINATKQACAQILANIGYANAQNAMQQMQNQQYYQAQGQYIPQNQNIYSPYIGQTPPPFQQQYQPPQQSDPTQPPYPPQQ